MALSVNGSTAKEHLKFLSNGGNVTCQNSLCFKERINLGSSLLPRLSYHARNVKNQNRVIKSTINSIRGSVTADKSPVQSYTFRYDLEGSSLEIVSQGASNNERSFVKLRIVGGNLVNGQLIAHWGALTPGKGNWALPGLRPDGTRDYKHRALQTPFTKEGDSLVLKIEFEPKYEAIEFTLKDEATNNWYKNQGGNFRVEIPESTATIDVDQIVIPLEILQVQAYLNWEKNGRQNYSAEREREEFEKTLRELQEQVARGETSIAELRQRLLGGEKKEEKQEEKKEEKKVEEVKRTTYRELENLPEIPEELLAVKAYIQWERNGKPNYTQEEETREYERGRMELQKEVMKGVSIEDLRKKLQEGGGEPQKEKKGEKIPQKFAPVPQRTSSRNRISRKNRDLGLLINRIESTGQLAVSSPQKSTEKAEQDLLPSKLRRISLDLEAENKSLFSKKIYKVGGPYELLVAVSETSSGPEFLLVSDLPEDLSIHWGLSKKRGSAWEKVQRTDFQAGFKGDTSLQFLEMKLESNEEYGGVSFVLTSGENWYKDNGNSDYFLGFKPKDSASKIDSGDGSGTAKEILDEIADLESEAEKSLMHRFNIGAYLLDKPSTRKELGLAAILVWFRYSATRQLTWNKNYNVKPREISTAQDKMTDTLQQIFRQSPNLREIVRMIMLSVGRGGQGDVGQRIRDEILVIQRHNDCKGGMMEEWHQKLHNNTSPDDVVICQALLDYLESGFDLDVYWQTLNSNGVSRERLKSYDRPIVSEPHFRASQREGLQRDLRNYMKSLKAVHSGADLESAVATCMGYTQGAHDFMKTVEIHPIRGLSSELPGLLSFVLEHVEDREVIPLIEGLVEARQELRPTLLNPQDRLKDLIFLDLALDGTVRTAVERSLDKLSQLSPEDLMYLVSLLVEDIVLSVDNNEELVYCLKEWRSVSGACRGKEPNWALRAKAVMDRTRLLLSDKAEHISYLLQPSASYLGAKLGVDPWVVSIFSEEMVRSGTSASLSQVLNKLDPILRSAADMGSWQVISPVATSGYVEVVEELGQVQEKVYERPTVLVAGRVLGEEEIPEGAVALLTPDMPDILSHVSVRARNSKVCFATCFDENILNELKQLHGKPISLKPTPNADLNFSIVEDSTVCGSTEKSIHGDASPPPGLKIIKKSFAGKFAVLADNFTSDLVGAKSRNIAGLRGKLPSWVNLPTSVALPFGSFDAVLADPLNKEVAKEIEALEAELQSGNVEKLRQIRETVLKLNAPKALIAELESALKLSGMPWPGDEGEERWAQAWTAIKKVWASKWNERAYFSTRKVGVNHSDLSMAVLVQEIIQADYAFVIHTTNPSTGDESEIYAEIVKGLGETLVGAYSGRALSFSAKKSNTGSPKILGFPSKRIGLFIRRTLIFRSDSNGEDLEGYAGAGLYDSVPMDFEEEIHVDYSSDPLVVDKNYQTDILSKIAQAGLDIEQALGSAQDIEGVIKDGKLYVVQTRPQM